MLRKTIQIIGSGNNQKVRNQATASQSSRVKGVKFKPYEIMPDKTIEEFRSIES